MKLRTPKNKALYKAGYAVGVRDADVGHPMWFPEDTPDVFDEGYEKGFIDTNTAITRSICADIAAEPLAMVAIKIVAREEIEERWPREILKWKKEEDAIFDVWDTHGWRRK